MDCNARFSLVGVESINDLEIRVGLASGVDIHVR
jgi:hypothetical protein